MTGSRRCRHCASKWADPWSSAIGKQKPQAGAGLRLLDPFDGLLQRHCSLAWREPGQTSACPQRRSSASAPAPASAAKVQGLNLEEALAHRQGRTASPARRSALRRCRSCRVASRSDPRPTPPRTPPGVGQARSASEAYARSESIRRPEGEWAWLSRLGRGQERISSSRGGHSAHPGLLGRVGSMVRSYLAASRRGRLLAGCSPHRATSAAFWSA